MKKSKLEKIMSILPITLAFIIVGVFVLMLVDVFPSNRVMIDILLVLLILCVGCISCLTATRILTKEKNKNNIYAYVILGLTGLTCLLWIIFIFVGQNLIDALINETATTGNLIGVWNFAKVIIFITIQTSLVNLVISNLFTFKKEYFAFQIIMYVSNFLVDLWLTIVIMSASLTEEGLKFSANWLIDSKFFGTVFALALAYSILAGAIMKSIVKKRTRDLTLDKQTILKTVRDNNTESQDSNSIEVRIKKLDELKEKGIITEEEYSAKKAKILEEI